MAQTMLVFADADSVPLAHVTEFYGLLGGGAEGRRGRRSGPTGRTPRGAPQPDHYDVFGSAELASVVERFLALP